MHKQSSVCLLAYTATCVCMHAARGRTHLYRRVGMPTPTLKASADAWRLCGAGEFSSVATAEGARAEDVPSYRNEQQGRKDLHRGGLSSSRDEFLAHHTSNKVTAGDG